MNRISRTFAAAACAIGLAWATTAAAAPVQVNIGIVTAPSFVHTLSAQKFKEVLDKELPGKYEVIIHHSGALGSETQVLQQLQLGTVQMCVCTTGPVEAFVPEIKAIEMPFLFSSYEQTDKVLDGPIGQDLLARFGKAGLVGMHFLDNGFRNLTNSKHAVKEPEDVKGLKIRTMESPTHLAIWRGIGANPTPMAWPITTQLQQGVLDGQENPISVIAAAKLSEVGQKYLTLTRHVYSALVFVGSKPFFDKLPAADQKAFMDAAAQASAYGRAQVRDNEAKELAALQTAGVQVVTDPDVVAFRARTQPVYASLKGDTKTIVDKILASEK
ncbi:DctP family TRAP transporter solute-binding subunit [Comamonas flocculans]|uniref:DctP family TRAP transporter solute-binding subunit n=1 Tax=Comamonas flocculans TaxID=2597701 RepID=A0A5B8RX99_9BURK|nr:DctP family TRAP transporter solute-binding subunit [Comamonas flocculans]QEA12437.1 DctP family TRAP transporter solute-binding subunit [Comamonas flocculans]